MGSYCHLSSDDREQIAILQAAGHSNASIARHVDFHSDWTSLAKRASVSLLRHSIQVPACCPTVECGLVAVQGPGWPVP